MNSLSNLNPILNTYCAMINEVENTINQEDTRDPASIDQSNSLAKLQGLLTQLFDFCTQNQAALSQTTSTKDLEFLKHFKESLIVYKQHHDGSTELNGLINEVIKQCNQITKKDSILNPIIFLPADALRLIFQKFSNLKDIVTWGSLCQRTRTIFLNAFNWQQTELFKLLIRDPTQEDLQQKFMQALVVFGALPKTGAFARELASLFFNQASDQVLAQFFSGENAENNEAFLRLLIPENLNRTSLMLWPNYFEHRKIFPIDIYLNNIEELDTRHSNPLKDEDVIHLLQNKKKLKSLMLKEPPSGKFIKPLEASKENLRVLHIEETFKLDTADFARFAAFTNLRHLKLTKGKLKDEDCDFLKAMSHLETLDLSFCKEIEGSFLKDLEPASQNLKELNLRGCQSLKSKGLQTLPNCPRLETLILTGADIEDQAITNIAPKIPNVQVLILEGCSKLTGAVLGHLSECRELRELVCNSWKEITDGHLQNLLIMPKLEILKLSGVSALTGRGFKDMEAPLKEIDLSGCPNIELQNLAHLKEFKKTLEKLTLANLVCKFDQLTFLVGMEKLRILNLQGNANLQEPALSSLSSLKNTLVELHLSFSPLKDDLNTVIAQLGNLQNLALRFCPNLSGQLLVGLENSSNLKALDIVGSNGIGLSAIRELKTKAPQLKISHNSRK